MRFPYILAYTALSVLLLGGCAAYPVKKIEYSAQPEITENDKPAPIKFGGLKLLLPPGMELGASRGGSFCASPAYPISRNVLAKEIDRKFLRLGFHDVMEANGYDVSGSPEVIFNPDDEEQRADYSVAGKLKDVQLNLCSYGGYSPDWLTGRRGQSGEMYVAIDWSVYDRLKRHVVYKVRTEGYTKRGVPNEEALSLLFNDAFEMAVHNLSSHSAFQDLIVSGHKPKKNTSDLKGEDQRERIFDPREEVVLNTIPLSKVNFAVDAEGRSKVAVMIQKGGHGSGFFITDEGHILTNAHVVGDARNIRVVSAYKKKGLKAEVLRIDKVRDVALLKLEDVPSWLEIKPLPVRADIPKVGEDIYAIGTPLDAYKMRTSVTKGIVSAYRQGYKYEGVRMNFIQGDVETHPGSSGGPLLDEYGNIIGMSVMGLHHGGVDEPKIGVGLNLFIPILEVYDVLDIMY